MQFSLNMDAMGSVLGYLIFDQARLMPRTYSRAVDKIVGLLPLRLQRYLIDPSSFHSYKMSS